MNGCCCCPRCGHGGCEGRRRGCGCGCHPRAGKGRHPEGCRPRPPGDGGAGTGRPTRHPGTDRGELDGSPLTPEEVGAPARPGSWPGQRKDMDLPYLFLRANPGDTGTRPAVGPFWESPDVLLLAGVHPDQAPPVPPELGQIAVAGRPNTVYAHVWNFGRRPAHDVVVEFYWCNPALGVTPAGLTLIGVGSTDLGHRGSGRSHHVVRCPEPWVPTMVNGGHECLLVRVYDLMEDMLTLPEWDAAVNRHLGQRNVHVVSATGGLDLVAAPLSITVGPLFGEPATVAVQRTHPAAVPWLQLRTGRGVFPAPAPATGTVGLSVGGGDTATDHQVTGDGRSVQLSTTDDPPPPGSAHVYRVTAAQAGALVGGYTVVVLG